MVIRQGERFLKKSTQGLRGKRASTGLEPRSREDISATGERVEQRECGNTLAFEQWTKAATVSVKKE